MINCAEANLQSLKLDRYGVNSDDGIIREMGSVSLGPKVITLSGFHCITFIERLIKCVKIKLLIYQKERMIRKTFVYKMIHSTFL